MSEALYKMDGGALVPSELTASPWDRDSQHAGPPAALMARALEVAVPEMAINRMTVEVLGPIPLRPVRVETEVVRSGRRIQLVETKLVDLVGTPLMLGRGWMVRRRTEPLAFDESPDGLPRPPLGPGKSTPFEHLFPHVDYRDFFGAALETRLAEGTAQQPGPATVWFRHRQAIVEGEDASTAQRMIALADSANGISWMVEPTRTLFVNIDLTMYLWREPVGEWLATRSATHWSPLGRGASDSELFDIEGCVGRSNQGLFIEPR